MKPFVIVESPYAGDIAKNEEYARKACMDCIRRGEAPFASHLFYTQFLDDLDPKERELGISLGYDLWRFADKIVFYIDLGISPGMQQALDRVPEDKLELRSLDYA